MREERGVDKLDQMTVKIRRASELGDHIPCMNGCSIHKYCYTLLDDEMSNRWVETREEVVREGFQMDEHGGGLF